MRYFLHIVYISACYGEGTNSDYILTQIFAIRVSRRSHDREETRRRKKERERKDSRTRCVMCPVNMTSRAYRIDPTCVSCTLNRYTSRIQFPSKSFSTRTRFLRQLNKKSTLLLAFSWNKIFSPKSIWTLRAWAQNIFNNIKFIILKFYIDFFLRVFCI